MGRYVARRLLQAVPLLLAILTLTFVLIHLAPGDPVTYLAGDAGDAAYYAQMRAKFGLDRPLLEQYLTYLANLARGDLGFSYAQRQPVLDIVLSRVPATLLLMSTALVISTVLGVWLALVASRHADRPADHAITVLTLLGDALPAFWLGQLLVLLFAVWLGWLPVQGMTSARGSPPGLAAVIDLARHLILPACTLGLLQLTLTTRVARTALREAMREDYVRTASAKGLPAGVVLRRHALPNALLPVVTVVGSHVGTMLAGATLTEIIFAWPGVGRLLYDASLARDYPLLLAIFLLASAAVILGNLATDLAYTRIDPRVRLR